MWDALPLPPLKPWPPNAISTTKPLPQRHSLVVHSFRNSEGNGGLVASLKSNEAKTKTKSPPADKKKLEQQQLSGSDILMALQRATSQKHNNKHKSRNINAAKRENQGGCTDTPSSSSIKPLGIKPEWRDRLQELERRLEELARA